MTDAEFEKALDAHMEEYWRTYKVSSAMVSGELVVSDLTTEAARWAREYTRKEMRVDWDKWNLIEKTERDLLASPEIRNLVEALKLRRMHDDDCADATDKFKPHEICECGASAAKDALTAFEKRFGRADEGEK